MNIIADPRSFLTDLFHCAVGVSVPERVLADFMPEQPKGRTIIIGAGKASARMAAAFEAQCAKDSGWRSPLSGLVVTQYGAGADCQHVEIVEASHPVPDQSGFEAAQRMVELVKGAGPDDLVVALVSGGGSSLLCLPAGGLSLSDKQQLNRILLASGAPISAMNTIRKMFSGIKGGQLGVLAHPAQLVSLVISDVPGDDASMVASGPTIADNSGLEEALGFVKQYNIALPDKLHTYLSQGGNGSVSPNDRRFDSAEHHIIASAGLSLRAAAKKAEDAGCDVEILADDIEGEARDVGVEQAKLLRLHGARRPFLRPLLILSGGETSVTLGQSDSQPGKGGRNTEYLLALAREISGLENVYCLAADTDGRDGSEDNAGAFCDGTSVSRLREKQLDVENFIRNHDAWSAFNILDDLLITGPTGTNINDFRALLVF